MDTYRNTPNVVSNSEFAPFHSGTGEASERGVALVMTLLLLSMVMALSLGMVIAMSSQSLIGGYYRNFRGSFYAADSGLNIAVHQIENQLVAGMPSVFASPPLTTAQATT